MNRTNYGKRTMYVLPENKSRYFAILKPSNATDNKKFLLVAFQYMSERDTFVSKTAFEKLPGQKIKCMKKDVVASCRKNERVVYDQDCKPVTRITSLYKPLCQQKADKPEDSISYITKQPKSTSVVDGITYRR